MTKSKRMLAASIGLIDVVIELLDARVPYSSRNPDIDTLAKNKKRIIVLNKADLANERATALWENHFRKQGCLVLAINSKDNDKKKAVCKSLRTAQKN